MEDPRCYRCETLEEQLAEAKGLITRVHEFVAERVEAAEIKERLDEVAAEWFESQ